MFWPNDFQTWTEVILNLITIFVALVGGLWAYTKFIIEKGAFPGVQFNIESETTGVHQDGKLIEFVLHLKNVGNSPLIVKNLRFDLLYLTKSEHAKLFDCGNGWIGKLDFPGSLYDDIVQEKVLTVHSKTIITNHPGMGQAEDTTGRKIRGFPVLSHDTFVLPGVDQAYTFTTVIPSSAAYVLAWASFEYGVKLKSMHTNILRFGRCCGLIQYSLTHINRPHTCERIFKVI